MKFDLCFSLSMEKNICTIFTEKITFWYPNGIHQYPSFFRKAAGSFNVEGARVPDKSFPGVWINGKSIVGAERA